MEWNGMAEWGNDLNQQRYRTYYICNHNELQVQHMYGTCKLSKMKSIKKIHIKIVVMSAAAINDIFLLAHPCC